MRRFSARLPTRRYTVLVREGVVKISANEPCPCGSGQKYKRCCRAATGWLGWWRRRRALRAKMREANGGQST
jgi:hypothetical protein